MEPIKSLIDDDELIEKDNQIRMATYLHELPQRIIQEKQRKLVDQRRNLSMAEINDLMFDVINEYPNCKKDHAKLNLLVEKLEKYKYDANMSDRLIDQAWRKSVEFVKNGVWID